MSSEAARGPGPYELAAGDYWDAGWRRVLPLPAGRKKPPPDGYTGRGALVPSRADVAAWAIDRPGANIALGLPEDVLGLDVDAYGAKQGRETLVSLIDRFGALPATWRSSSRDDGTSGIYLFRVPIGLAWPGEAGPGVELIQAHHRYAVVWPSMHPDTGMPYRWRTPAGATSLGAVPQQAEQPWLPDGWIAGLTEGLADDGMAKASMSDVEATMWLAAHGGGEPCAAVRALVERYVTTRFGGGASRHDAARDATAGLLRFAAEGHTGVVVAVRDIGLAFAAAVGEDAHREQDRGEWQRLYLGAVRLAVAQLGGLSASPVMHDPCDSSRLVLAAPVPEATADAAASANGGSQRHAEAMDRPFAAADARQAVREAQAAAESRATGPAAALSLAGEIEPGEAALLLAQRRLDAEVAVQRTRRQARRLLDDAEAAEAFREPPSAFTLADELLLPDDDEAWRVAELLPAGGNVLLTASFKSGKTTLDNHVARCLVDGEAVFGRFAVTPGRRVAIFNYEVGRSQFRRWLRDVGIEHADRVATWPLRGFVLPLHVPVVAERVVRWLAERDVGVWMLDPFARAFGGTSENDNAEVGRWLEAVDAIKEQAGVGEVVLATHTGRAVAEPGQEHARGATRLDDWADVRWMLTKDDEGQRFFAASGRDVEVAEFELGYDEATRALSATGRAGRKETAGTDLSMRVRAIIETTPGIGNNEIGYALWPYSGKLTGPQSGHVRETLAKLQEDHLVRREPGPRTSNRWFSEGPRVLPYSPGEDSK